MRESLTRIEELPSGKRVFYIDVSNIPEREVQSYMKHFRDALNEPNSYALPVRYVIPVQHGTIPVRSTDYIKMGLFILVFIQVFILGLALIK
jgi:hypothetical protein